MLFYDKENGIYGFHGEYRWLSNFYPCKINFEGLVYPSVEHAYQAAKTLDENVRQKFVDPDMSPGEAKYQGLSVPLRKNWNEPLRLQTMRRCLEEKFAIPSFRDRLLKTGNVYIEETNTWNDTFWGVCKEKGHNHLGNLIMSIREKIAE